MRIIVISDTHSLHHGMHDVPDGDVLIHAGDISSNFDDLYDILDFSKWISKYTHSHKLIIAGNHDWGLYKEETRYRAEDILNKNCTYLRDEEIIIDGIKFYGSPWQPEFCSWAFNLPRNGSELEEKWNKIPDDTDILITHGPPKGILDLTEYDKYNAGCEKLLERVLQIKPKFHIFGHLHEGYGQKENEHTTFINASICTLKYLPVNKPIVINV